MLFTIQNHQIKQFIIFIQLQMAIHGCEHPPIWTYLNKEEDWFHRIAQ